nr:retrovirus-related Pol polyprotein from transposon TNT 1-94 [Tanacetum cinerariifolium]
MAGSDNESDDASVYNEATNTQQQPNIQPQIITTVSNNNAKFPYLKKDEYEVWAMKMEYWITNNDMNILKVIQTGNNMKRTGKDHDGRVIILPPTTAEEHIAVQREPKARTTLLQSILDDHKGYDRMQKIPSQLNQLKAKPEDEDINLKFLRALPSSWSQAFPLPGESSHWQYKFPLPVKGVPTARRMEILLQGVCTAMMKKLPVKENWQLHQEDGLCLAHDSSSNKGLCNCCIKNDLRKLKGNSVDTKFAKTSVLGKPALQPLRNQSVIRQPNAFKHESPPMSKQRFASQVDVNHNVLKPVTQHYLPKKSEFAFAKLDHMIASSSSRNSSKNMSRFSSNDMVHNYYLDEAKKKTQEREIGTQNPVWQPTGRIFKSVGLRWLPTGKLFDSCTSTIKSEPTHGSNEDISKIYECKQTLDLSAEGIQHQTSITRTPEQNGVVERRNRTLVEAARTILSAAKVPLFFWTEAIATTCFTQNRSLIIPHHEKTPYHIINDRKSSVKFFHIFGSVCYIARDGENLDKMKEKDQNSSNPAPECQTMTLDQNSSDPALECQTMVSDQNSSDPAPEYHPLEQVIGNPSQPVRTRRQLESDAEMCMFALTVSQTKPKNIKEAMADSAWIESMQEELYQFDR